MNGCTMVKPRAFEASPAYDVEALITTKFALRPEKFDLYWPKVYKDTKVFPG